MSATVDVPREPIAAAVRAAVAAGLWVGVDGDRLRIRGPRRLGPTVQGLVARKPEVVQLLRGLVALIQAADDRLARRGITGAMRDAPALAPARAAVERAWAAKDLDDLLVALAGLETAAEALVANR
jgi:hypothetical protein